MESIIKSKRKLLLTDELKQEIDALSHKKIRIDESNEESQYRESEEYQYSRTVNLKKKPKKKKTQKLVFPKNTIKQNRKMIISQRNPFRYPDADDQNSLNNKVEQKIEQIKEDQYYNNIKNKYFSNNIPIRSQIFFELQQDEIAQTLKIATINLQLDEFIRIYKHQEVKDRQKQKSAVNNPQVRDQNQLNYSTTQLEFNLNEIQRTNELQMLQLKYNYNFNFKKKQQLSQKITQLKKLQQNQQQIQQKVNQKKAYQDFIQKQFKQTTQKLHKDTFEISIIKLQLYDTLLRYGYTLTTQKLQSKMMFDKIKYSTYQPQISKTIDFTDLKIFVLTSLYPMSAQIFNDFSFQSSVYKYMFNQDNGDSEGERLCIILQQRIKKYIHQKKHYSSLQNCLRSNVQIRKRKITLICSNSKFQKIIEQLQKQLKEFFNRLIQMNNIKIQYSSNQHSGASFQHYKLWIEYLYQGVKINTSFDILHMTAEEVTMLDVETLRKKSGKFQPVFFWFQIPKCALKPRMLVIQQINNMMRRCEYFSMALEKQKQKQKKQAKQKN